MQNIRHQAVRRLGEAWKRELETRPFANIDASNPFLAGFRQDSFITLRLARYL